MATEHIVFTSDQVMFRMRLCKECGGMIDVQADGLMPNHYVLAGVHEIGAPLAKLCPGSQVSAFRSHWSETTVSESPHQPPE
jgi:hypothetical protein